ncbi:MAG: DUF460 domain-containing protein [Candidatus Woesearchaeota archaeon]
MQPLILGVDPGTTLGYAVLDTNGRVIELSSSKELEFNSLLRIVTDIGRVVVVGTDKKHAPDLVRRLATKVGAKVIEPEEEMLVETKKELTKGFSYKNEHERDALASAIFAFKKIRPLLLKVEKFVEQHQKQQIKDSIIKLVVVNGYSIHLAVELIEHPDDEIVKAIKEGIKQNGFGRQYDRLFQRFLSIKEDNEILRAQIYAAQKEISRLRMRDYKSTKMSIDQKINRLFIKKDARIFGQEKEIERLKLYIESLINEKQRFIEMICTKGTTVVKKLDTLSEHEIKKKAFLHIDEDDIIAVKKPEIFSHSVIQNLSPRAIILEKPVRHLDKFVLIPRKDIRPLYEAEHLLFCNKKELENLLSGKRILQKIISEYQTSDYKPSFS